MFVGAKPTGDALGHKVVRAGMYQKRGGGGVWNPKVCVPKIIQINISFRKFHFSHYEIWVRGWGGGGGYPLSSNGCQPFYDIPRSGGLP